MASAMMFASCSSDGGDSNDGSDKNEQAEAEAKAKAEAEAKAKEEAAKEAEKEELNRVYESLLGEWMYEWVRTDINSKKYEKFVVEKDTITYTFCDGLNSPNIETANADISKLLSNGAVWDGWFGLGRDKWNDIVFDVKIIDDNHIEVSNRTGYELTRVKSSSGAGGSGSSGS